MNDVDEVLRRIDYPAFYRRNIQGFNVNGKKDVLCLCPFHEDKEPSFSVNVETGLYFCHACGEKGNAIQFIQKKEGLDFKAALQRLKADEGITDTTPPSAAKKAPPAPPRSAFLSLDQVKNLHSMLVKKEAVLKKFQSKYGLDLPTIEKHLLGFQNEHFVIPIEIEPGYWFYKEHKGIQSRGAKVSLYPAGVIKEVLPFIVIAEGEFKALLLNQLGFPSVSGTGGANTWKKEWNSLFAGLNVIMAYDNDEPGRQGALRAAESLRGTAKSVKAVQWPSSMDTREKKDVTDFFVTLGKKKEDFTRLIENAREIVREIKEIDGFKFVEPEGFKVSDSRVEQLVYWEGKVTGRKIVSFTPLLITGCALDVDTGTEEVEITFKQRWKWKSIWVPKRTIMDMKKFIEVSDHGLQVSSVNVKRIIEYLSAFEAYNMDLIKLSYVVKGVGWKTVQDRKVYILHKMVSEVDKPAAGDEKMLAVEFVAEAGFERFVKAMKPEGKYPEWRELITESLKFPLAGFAFYSSFAAPLLRMLKAPNFIIDFWGNTSVGKTTVLELAASVWGNPHKEAGGLVFSWDSTRVFLERMAHFFNDAPIFPDDSQTVDDRTMTSMLYQIANGVGKGRGSLIGIRHNPTWHTVCFSTGERPLTQCTTFSGARARTIEIYGSPFPNAGGNFINDLKQGVREHYGHAGPKFIAGLLPLWDNPDEMTRLKEDHKRYQRAMSLSANSEVGDRYSHYFATVKVAADLVYRTLGIGDLVEAEESIARVFNALLSETVSEGDISTRAMEYVLSWASSNEGLFKVNERGASFGVWREGEYIGVYPDRLSAVLREGSFPEKAILRGWATKNWIEVDEGHLSVPKRVYIDGTSKLRRFIVIDWKVVEGFLEK